MRPLIPAGDRFAVILALSFLGIGALSAPFPVAAQAQYIVQPVAEIKVKQLPKGELFWRVESFRPWKKRRPLHRPIAGTRTPSATMGCLR